MKQIFFILFLLNSLGTSALPTHTYECTAGFLTGVVHACDVHSLLHAQVHAAFAIVGFGGWAIYKERAKFFNAAKINILRLDEFSLKNIESGNIFKESLISYGIGFGVGLVLKSAYVYIIQKNKAMQQQSAA